MVASDVMSVKFAFGGAPIQTARHHNASPSATHNDCVPLELVILVFAANLALGFLSSLVLTALTASVVNLSTVALIKEMKMFRHFLFCWL